jgi:hypothetical protein
MVNSTILQVHDQTMTFSKLIPFLGLFLQTHHKHFPAICLKPNMIRIRLKSFLFFIYNLTWATMYYYALPMTMKWWIKLEIKFHSNENLNLVELEFNSIRYKSNSIHSKFKIQFNLHAVSFNIFIFFINWPIDHIGNV